MIPNHITLVLAGGAAHFFTGWVLNSDMLLGQVWKSKDAAKKCGLSKNMNVNLAAQFAASLALSAATCVAICVFEKHQASGLTQDAMSRLHSLFFSPEHAGKSLMQALHTVTFIWAGFIIPTSVGEVIWCGHNWKMWMIEMGMELAGLISIAATIAYLE